MNSPSHSNGNGKFTPRLGQARPAKWLDEDTGQPPPPAFVVPLTDADLEILEASPDDEAGEQSIREWATTEFNSRYAGALSGFEEEMEFATDQLRNVETRTDRCMDKREGTPQRIVTQKTFVEFPSGFLRQWLIFVGLVLCCQIGLEWFNAASIAARFDFQDMKAALAFTLSLALAPVALKLFSAETSVLKRRVFVSLLVGSLFCFIHVFTDTYLTTDANLSSDQLLDQIGQAPQRFQRFWQDPLNPHWRFLWQMTLFTIVGFAFSNHLASHVSVITTTEEKENPAYLDIEDRLAKLAGERERWGKRLADSDGNRREWQASLERHVLRCLALFHEEQCHRGNVKALQTFLEQQVQRRTRSHRFSNHNTTERN